MLFCETVRVLICSTIYNTVCLTFFYQCTHHYWGYSPHTTCWFPPQKSGTCYHRPRDKRSGNSGSNCTLRMCTTVYSHRYMTLKYDEWNEKATFLSFLFLSFFCLFFSFCLFLSFLLFFLFAFLSFWVVGYGFANTL